jgi:DNA-binding Lrp family transcriptional regulator
MDKDALRVEIARELEKDCRTSPAELAQLLGAEEAEVAEETKAMEADGVIVRYGAKVNWEKLGGQGRVFATIAVQANPERDVGFDGIARRIMHFPEVHSLYLISGMHDFDVVIEGESMREVAYFVAQRLAVIPGVRGTATQFVLQTYKRDGDVLFEADDTERLLVTP